MKKISASPDYKGNKDNASSAEALIVATLSKLDAVALGVSLGTLFGLVIFLATNFLVFKGGEVVGPNLGLLSQYFIGYEVTHRGSLIGFAYGLMSGFVLGFLIASLRNLIIKVYLHVLRLKGAFLAINDHIDNP